MKIAYFLDIPSGLGGAGNLLLQQAALMSAIYDVIVAIPCDGSGKGNEEYIGRCHKKGLAYRVLHYETSYNFYNIDYIKALECKGGIEEFAVEEGIHFFHSVQLNIAVEMVSRELKIPHLMDIYQLREDEFALAFVDIYPHCHLCDSELYAERWSSMLNVWSKCIRPVAPLDCIRKKVYFPKQRYKMVILGSVCERKNQLAAIMAVESCLEWYDITLEIAGSEETGYAGRCKRYVEQHHLKNRVHFRNFVSDITGLLLESDCILCTSTDESFPSSIVEAVTYGLTVISTPVAGLPELFQDQYNAYISDGFDEKAVAASIMDCMDDYKNGHIVEIHKNVQKTWKEHFAPDVVRTGIKQYYDEIINGKQIGSTDAYQFVPVEEMKALCTKIGSISGNEDIISKRVFYYTYLRKTLTGGKAYIWGAGKLGNLAYQLIWLLGLDIEVIAFIDSNKCGECCGKPVIHPDKIEYDKADYFFISFWEKRESAIEMLIGKGVAYNRKSFLLP